MFSGEKLRALEPPVVALRCGHPLHVDCAEAAVRAGGARHVRCPLCRERTSADRLIANKQLRAAVATYQADWAENDKRRRERERDDALRSRVQSLRAVDADDPFARYLVRLHGEIAARPTMRLDDAGDPAIRAALAGVHEPADRGADEPWGYS